MFDKIKIKRIDENMICLDWNGNSIMIVCSPDSMMISSDSFESVGVSGKQDQLIDDNGVFFRKISVKNKNHVVDESK